MGGVTAEFVLAEMQHILYSDVWFGVWKLDGSGVGSEFEFFASKNCLADHRTLIFRLQFSVHAVVGQAHG